jgi:hypothetical protein
MIQLHDPGTGCFGADDDAGMMKIDVRAMAVDIDGFVVDSER